MKALKVLVIILLASFSYHVANAQTAHHHKRHHSVKRHHHMLKRH
ncbi:hypothetical protein [Mucilaginibacter sp. BT774]|nr:hypothetical protein [Mucilaginibacter sp. BT774]MDO3626646.1 hypothetical protein [Mucilaginibacter sp. BT774]